MQQATGNRQQTTDNGRQARDDSQQTRDRGGYCLSLDLRVKI
jgi:hypothetical protein